MRFPLFLALLASPALAGPLDYDDDDAPAWELQPEARRIDPAAKITRGVVQVARPDGAYELPLLHTTVDAEISGLVAEVEVTQSYANPFDEPIEVLYLFPLPDGGAVHAMTLRVGDRRIQGEIKRKQEARRIYETAKRQGRTAALLDQERPNVFTQRVANILPGETIDVTISFVDVLKYDRGGYEWVFPLVVGPRYTPPEGTGQGPTGDDSANIDPMMSEGPTGNRVDIRVDLDAGVPIQALRSPSHEIVVDEESDQRAWIELDPADGVPNKDFILRYDVAGERPEAALITHYGEDGGYFLLMIQPQADEHVTQDVITPKDLVFLVDTSCSQSGAPMAAAKRAMELSIAGMNRNDHFSIMRFSSDVSPALSGRNTKAKRNEAIQFVRSFQGAGGTNMLAGVQAAMDLANGGDRLRTILMITDGYVGNDKAILGALEEDLGRNRMFVLGTGSSVNRHLLDRAAQVGRGDLMVVRPDEPAEPVVQEFFERIRSPLLTDIDIEASGVELLDVLPDPIPDLFAGQPVILVGRYDQPGEASIRLTGRLANEPWSKTIHVDLPADQPEHGALAQVWARGWIEDLELRQNVGQGFDDRDRFEREITELALSHHLMSQYTSFVAVEERVRTEGDAKTVRVPSETPEFVEFESVADEEDERAYPRYGMKAPPPASPAATGQLRRPTRSRGLGSPKASPAPEPMADPSPSAQLDRRTATFGSPADLLSDTSTLAEDVGKALANSSGVAIGRGDSEPSGLRGGAGGDQGGLIGNLGSGYGRGPHEEKERAQIRGQVSSEAPVVSGSLDADSVRRTLLRYRGRFRQCYERELKSKPALHGKLVVRFTLQPGGTVAAVKLDSSTVGDEPMEACVVRELGRIRFVPWDATSDVTVTYPLLFKLTD